MNFTIFDPGSGYASKHFKILQAADNKALAGFYFIPTPQFAPHLLHMSRPSRLYSMQVRRKK